MSCRLSVHKNFAHEMNVTFLDISQFVHTNRKTRMLKKKIVRLRVAFRKWETKKTMKINSIFWWVNFPPFSYNCQSEKKGGRREEEENVWYEFGYVDLWLCWIIQIFMLPIKNACALSHVNEIFFSSTSFPLALQT